jgi:hypothetical protein
MAKKPTRARNERRAQARTVARRETRDAQRLRAEVRDREALARMLPGGTPTSPVEVASASVVEIRARETPCVQCGGTLTLVADRAESTPRGVLRELDLACRVCHAPRRLWFRVAPALSS